MGTNALGHARSKDLVHWETLPIALSPGDVEDEGGCFSGSAVVYNNKMYLNVHFMVIYNSKQK